MITSRREPVVGPARHSAGWLDSRMRRAPTDEIPHSSKVGVSFFRSFLVEQTRPRAFLHRHRRRHHRPDHPARAAATGRTVLDVGAGQEQFGRRFVEQGAPVPRPWTSACDSRAPGSRAAGRRRPWRAACPSADGFADIVMSNNVMEHVPGPGALADEMLRVVRPGGLRLHLLHRVGVAVGRPRDVALAPPRWALRRAGATSRRARTRRPRTATASRCTPRPSPEDSAGRGAQQGARSSRRRPRYHPDWADSLLHGPGVREVLTWNLMIVLRRA